MGSTATPWQRVSRRRPCLICGRADWCLYAGPADAPTAAICARVESPKRCGEAGWWHALRHDGPTWAPWRRTITRAVRMMQPENGRPDFAKLAAEYQEAVEPDALLGLAKNFGVSIESLRRLGIGWAAEHRAWCFPMSDRNRHVRGIRLRLPNGRKLAVRGGREGLFFPTGLDAGGLLLVCEGPTDTAAVLDFGFQAVGRPSCSSGVGVLVELLQQRQPWEVVVVADGDGPGQRGAANLASVLVAYCRSVRVITPPTGIKDARQWKQRGATAAEVQAAIDAAPVRRLRVTVTKKGRCRDARVNQTR